MLEQIIQHINCRLKLLNIIGKTFGLCETIKDGSLSFAAQYSNGEYKNIQDIDYYEGVSYHRIRQAFTENSSEENSTTACDIYIERAYPMRLISIIKKDIKGDNEYSDEKIYSLLSNKLSINNNNELRMLLKIDNIQVNIISSNLNRDDVFAQEFKGVDQFIKYEYSLLSIDYNIIIGANKSCFANC